jgi:DHA1 family tetracycline resistance protein-like MFS transporter
MASWARVEAGIPVGAIGLLFGCYAGGELIAAPLIGGIADRTGRRPVLIASSLGVGVGVAALFFVHGIVLTAIVLLLTGICESVLHPTIMTVIADVTPPPSHRRWFSLARVSSDAGHILGPAVGALFALLSLRAVFLAAGGVLLLGGIVMLVAFAETSVSGTDSLEDDGYKSEEEEGLSALLPVFRDGQLAKLLLLVTLFEISGSWIESVIPLYAHDAGTLTSSGVGMLFAYAAGLNSMVIVSPPGLWQTRATLFFPSRLRSCGYRDCLVAISLALKRKAAPKLSPKIKEVTNG